MTYNIILQSKLIKFNKLITKQLINGNNMFLNIERISKKYMAKFLTQK